MLTLFQARQYYNNFKENHPDKFVKLGLDVDFSDEKLKDCILIAENYWLSENISEDEALMKAITFFSKMHNTDETPWSASFGSNKGKITKVIKSPDESIIEQFLQKLYGSK